MYTFDPVWDKENLKQIQTCSSNSLKKQSKITMTWCVHKPFARRTAVGNIMTQATFSPYICILHPSYTYQLIIPYLFKLTSQNKAVTIFTSATIVAAWTEDTTGFLFQQH